MLRTLSRPPIPRLLRPRSRRLASPTPLRPFVIERYDGWYDGSASLSSSECEPLSLAELLGHADAEGLRRWETLSLGYVDPSSGSEWLRREIAAGYTTVAADDVNVCAPQEGIYLSVRALCRPGDHVVVAKPSYQSLSEVARSIGCEVSAWVPDGIGGGSDDATARFDVDALRSLLRPGKTRMVIANFPHNPTGALPTAAEMAEIIAACDAAGCHLLVDEMYRGLEHGDHATLIAAVDTYERGVSLGGLSKTYGLPGLRVGWLASRDAQLMARVAELKDYTTICPAAPSEALALIALRARASLLQRGRTLVGSGLDAARTFVREHREHLTWCEPSGGTFAFVGLRTPRADAGGGGGGGGDFSEAYAAALRQRTGLMLIPSACFEGCPDHRLRLTFGRAGLGPMLERWGEDLRRHGLGLHHT